MVVAIVPLFARLSPRHDAELILSLGFVGGFVGDGIRGGGGGGDGDGDEVDVVVVVSLVISIAGAFCDDVIVAVDKALSSRAVANRHDVLAASAASSISDRFSSRPRSSDWFIPLFTDELSGSIVGFVSFVRSHSTTALFASVMDSSLDVDSVDKISFVGVPSRALSTGG